MPATCLIAPTWSADEQAYVVPPDREMRFTFVGVVEIDPARSTVMPVGARDLLLTRLAPDGDPVRAGDPIAWFSTETITRQVPLRALDARISDEQLRAGELRRQRELADLEDQRARLRGDLAVAEAALARARVVDAAKLGELESAAQRAEERARTAADAYARAQDLNRAGDLPTLRLEDARVALASARLDVAPARQAVEVASRPDQRAIDRLVAEVRQLRTRLGLDDAGEPIAGQGLSARIEALRVQHQRAAEADRFDRQRATRAAHEVERDACDHTPVAWLECVPADAATDASAGAAPESAKRGPGGRRGRGGDQAAPVATPGAAWSVDVVAAGAAPADGWTADAAWDEARGWGWVGAAPPARASDGPGACAGCALVDRTAIWRARLPAGRWRIRVGFGADQDWDGAFARVDAGDGAATVLYVARRVPPGAFPVAETVVEVGAAPLQLVFADEPGKRLRAAGDGVVIHQEWVKPGLKSRWPSQQIVNVADRRKIVVRGRVHQDLSPLLRAAEAPPRPAGGSPIAALQARLAVDHVRLRSATGAEVVARVVRVGDEPVAWSRAPVGWDGPTRDLDHIAAEVELGVADDDALRLAIGERVEVEATVALPDGVVALPSHLVRGDGDRSAVAIAGAERGVVAARVGDAFAVDGVRPGEVVVPPRRAEDAARQRGAWAGSVVAGRRVPITLARSWGRIREIVPDGTQVAAGDVVVRLYNPSIEDRKQEFEQDKRKAQQAYLLAAEQRRSASLQAAMTGRDETAGERLARIALATAAESDPLLGPRAAADRAKADLDAAAKAAVHAAAADPSAGDAARLAGAAVAARRSALTATARALDAVAAARSLDWLKLRAADGAWRDAIARLALREDGFILARVEAQVGAALADLQLANALEGNRQERFFNQVKDLRAPVAGRIFFGFGWNDQLNRNQKFDKEAYVWTGMTVAEVLDMSALSFTAEVPESEYRRLRVGMAASVEFAQLDARLDAAVTRIARSLGRPKDRRDQGRDDTAAVDTVIAVTVDLAPPAELRDRLVPGTKGLLVLP